MDNDDDVIEEVEEQGVLKPSMNNLKLKPVLPYDWLSYDSSPSLTPPDSPRDCSSLPLISFPEHTTKLEINGGKNGAYNMVADYMDPKQSRSPSPVLAKTDSDAPVFKGPSPEELRSIRLRNNNVQQLIFKTVKRPVR